MTCAYGSGDCSPTSVPGSVGSSASVGTPKEPLAYTGGNLDVAIGGGVVLVAGVVLCAIANRFNRRRFTR